MLHYYVNVMKAVFPQFGEYQTEVMALFFLGRLFICCPQCRHISLASTFNLLENTNITKFWLLVVRSNIGFQTSLGSSVVLALVLRCFVNWLLNCLILILKINFCFTWIFNRSCLDKIHMADFRSWSVWAESMWKSSEERWRACSQPCGVFKNIEWDWGGVVSNCNMGLSWETDLPNTCPALLV